ncbi:TPR domain protein [Carpediemonas membranifera]|uniref:TPR domain protein n=1 Tax=Carpediemonas membranifera TaxID=201153 RepID=A0A8J6AXJ5_9EUKA|nr:TPR domain protein [Carpediemonas membranifera]|eukprot:KAG9396613.1 TPR domain protein [Carpediemonas membranifera]
MASKKLHSCYAVTFSTSTEYFVKYYLWSSDLQRYPLFSRVIGVPVGGSVSLFVHRGAILRLPGEREAPTPADMNVKLTLIEKRDVTSFRSRPADTPTQQICCALVYQSLGDDFFFNRNYAQSLATYEDGLRLLALKDPEVQKPPTTVPPETPPEVDLFAQSDYSFRASIFNSITLAAATSALMTRSFGVVIVYCDRILSQAPKNIVAIIRKIQALRMLKKYDMAMMLASSAVRLAPEDPNVLREWRHSRMALKVGIPDDAELDVAFGGSLFIGSPQAFYQG